LKIVIPVLKYSALLFVISCLLQVAWLIIDTYRYRAFHDAGHVPDLSHYVQHYGVPEHIYLKRVNQENYYGLVPPSGDYSAWVSGPPVFLYDRTGKLWDYTPDSGDLPFVKSGMPMSRWDGEVENPMQLIRSKPVTVDTRIDTNR